MLVYFRGWKRRAGLVLLLIATVFSVGWVRSHFADDAFVFVGKNLSSHRGAIEELVDTSIALTDLSGQTRTFSARVTCWRLPYWSVVLPSAALSAWLLLSKHRLPTDTELPDREFINTRGVV